MRLELSGRRSWWNWSLLAGLGLAGLGAAAGVANLTHDRLFHTRAAQAAIEPPPAAPAAAAGTPTQAMTVSLIRLMILALGMRVGAGRSGPVPSRVSADAPDTRAPPLFWIVMAVYLIDYVHAINSKEPQPFPEKGDLTKPWSFGGKSFMP